MIDYMPSNEFPDEHFLGREGVVKDVCKAIREKLSILDEGETLNICLDHIEIIDFSFSHQLLLDTLFLEPHGNLRRKYMVFSNPTRLCYENFQAALDFEKRPALFYLDGKWEICWRKFQRHLKETFLIVKDLKSADAPTIAAEHEGDMTLPNCNNRLKQLYNYKLIDREEYSQKTGGTAYTYHSLI